MPRPLRPLVVKVTCGADDPERANQGLTVAATALSAGASVSLWLTGEAAWLGAGRGGFSLPQATPALVPPPPPPLPLPDGQEAPDLTVEGADQ